MVQSATALMAAGDTATALRALVYLACSQQADGGFPQNFWIDGTPYWRGVQLDEVAFPVILAWRLWKADALRQFDPYPMVEAAARFLVRRGPATEQDRWEECGGYSPSTLAATIAGLVCAADLAAARGRPRHVPLPARPRRLPRVARRTLDGDDRRAASSPGIPRHYIGSTRSDIGNPLPRRRPEHRRAGAREPASRATAGSTRPRTSWTPGFSNSCATASARPGDPLIEDSLRVVDEVLKVDTPYGPCWRRYNHDGYGPREDGGPYEGWGKGRAWPLLVGERAHYELAAGRRVDHLVAAIECFASKGGMLPEQVWDEDDIPSALMYRGRTAGSAMPLMWAHAEYVKLLRSIADGRVFDLDPGRRRPIPEPARPDRPGDLEADAAGPRSERRARCCGSRRNSRSR